MVNSSTLLHPVRQRIAQTLLRQGQATTHQLHEHLPDIPIATLYRHINHLVSHGLIEVAAQHQVRGTSESTYRLAPGLSNPSAEDLKALSNEQLLTAFTVFTSGLINDFGRYLGDEPRDLQADRVSFAQASFWASDEEMDELGEVLMTAIQRLLNNETSPTRRRRTLSTVLMPTAFSQDNPTDGSSTKVQA